MNHPPHARAPDNEVTAFWAENTLKGQYSLRPHEELWKARAPLLSKYGYSLRKRYREDWTPSWLGTDMNPFFCEDSIDSLLPQVIDATRVEDGMPVCIKAIKAWTTEVKLACYLSSPELLKDPRNPAVPVLDVFSDGGQPETVFLVMPMLRSFDDPPFQYVAEIVDFVVQVMAGLAFLHHYGIAHRDCTGTNIMMNGNALYFEPFHPVRQGYNLSATEELQPLSRMERPVKYHLIDFELACLLPDDDTPKVITGRGGRDRDVPEISRTRPYDPFKVDVFTLGRVFSRFTEMYQNVDFLLPLIEAMMQQKPVNRPTAQEALEWFHKIRRALGKSKLEMSLERHDATVYKDNTWEFDYEPSEPAEIKPQTRAKDVLVRVKLMHSPTPPIQEKPLPAAEEPKKRSFWQRLFCLA